MKTRNDDIAVKPAAPIRLIVGLANPGPDYANTRHNAGAWLVDEIAKTSGFSLHFESKLQGFHHLFKQSDSTCHLFIPKSFMNESGRAIKLCMNYYKITHEELLIAHDDIDLGVGTIKLKFAGGDGGHNGLKDIINTLHTKNFHRLRIGVGRPTHQKDVTDYVLKPPSKTDKNHIDQCINKAVEVLPLILSNQIPKAMQQLHTII